MGNNFCKLKWKFWYWLVNSLSSVCSTFFHLSDVSVPLWLVLPAGPSDSAPHFASSSPQPCPPLLSAPRHPSKPGGIKNNNIWEGPYIKCARRFLAFFDPLHPPARILHAFEWPLPLRKSALKAVTPPLQEGKLVSFNFVFTKHKNQKWVKGRKVDFWAPSCHPCNAIFLRPLLITEAVSWKNPLYESNCFGNHIHSFFFPICSLMCPFTKFLI